MLRGMSTAENPPADRERERLRREAAGLRQQRLSLDRALREAMARNERLTGTLRTAQEDIRRLRQALAQELEAPMNEALVLRVNPPVRAGALSAALVHRPAWIDRPVTRPPVWIGTTSRSSGTRRWTVEISDDFSSSGAALPAVK